MSSPLAGRTALVTGAAGGLGFPTALGLARQGARVILADRNVAAGEDAARRIREAGVAGSAEFRTLDLAELSAIRGFAAALLAEVPRLDLLINNAGLLPPMQRASTRDGFELAFGVAHLGHFALTGLLLPALLRSDAARVVSLSSISHVGATLDFDDLQRERSYVPTAAYAQSKLATLMFAIELQRRAEAAGWKLLSLAAHPGISRTGIGAGWNQELRRGFRERLEAAMMVWSMKWFGQSAEQGAESTLYAATAPEVIGGGYYGPKGLGQFKGAPALQRPHRRALDSAVQQRLWQESERLTGVRYDALRQDLSTPPRSQRPR